jgi:hypothetical protein
MKVTVILKDVGATIEHFHICRHDSQRFTGYKLHNKSCNSSKISYFAISSLYYALQYMIWTEQLKERNSLRAAETKGCGRPVVGSRNAVLTSFHSII